MAAPVAAPVAAAVAAAVAAPVAAAVAAVPGRRGWVLFGSLVVKLNGFSFIDLRFGSWEPWRGMSHITTPHHHTQQYYKYLCGSLGNLHVKG